MVARGTTQDKSSLAGLRPGLYRRMETQMQIAPEATSVPESMHRSKSDHGPKMQLATFIERRFIPGHVQQKSSSGRTHYHAILKHVLPPETVDRFFAPYVGVVKARLRSLPDWPYLDNVRLCDLSPNHVRQLTASASARGYSSQTVKHIRNVLGAIVSHATREGVFSGANPISQVEIPPMVRKETPNLTIAQARAILRALRYPQRELALITMTVGMSISEICGLQWKCVNLTTELVYSDGDVIPPRYILVKRQANNLGLVNVNPNRIRMTEMPEPLFRKLLSLKRNQKRPGPDSFVIPSQPDAPHTPIPSRMLNLKPIGQELGMPWLSWQVFKRAHEALVMELRVQLSEDLALCTR